MIDEIYAEFEQAGFERVERDDRLLDVFPQEDREKGIELWDKWSTDTVEIIRFHAVMGRKGISNYSFPRKHIEQALVENTKLELE
jgi:hypothetical protein